MPAPLRSLRWVVAGLLVVEHGMQPADVAAVLQADRNGESAIRSAADRIARRTTTATPEQLAAARVEAAHIAAGGTPTEVSCPSVMPPRPVGLGAAAKRKREKSLGPDPFADPVGYWRQQVEERRKLAASAMAAGKHSIMRQLYSAQDDAVEALVHAEQAEAERNATRGLRRLRDPNQLLEHIAYRARDLVALSPDGCRKVVAALQVHLRHVPEVSE